MILFLVVFLSVISTISICGLVISIRKNLEMMERLEQTDEVVQKSIEILEEQHTKIDQKTKIEVFSDEPVIRQLIQDIAEARDAVLLIENMLQSNQENQETS